MMMPGIKWDLAFSSSNKVDGDLRVNVVNGHDQGDPGDVCQSPDEHLRLAKGDVLEELAILEQHPVH